METSLAVEAYTILNDKLLHLIMNGKGDTDEAEEVRDEMDFYWIEMTPEERDLIRKRNETAL